MATMKEEFVEYVMDQLGGLGNVRARKMFDGWGEVPTEILEDKDKLAQWAQAAAKLSRRKNL